MKKRSREGPFDGEGMDYFQVPITDAALPVIPAEGAAAQLTGLTNNARFHPGFLGCPTVHPVNHTEKKYACLENPKNNCTSFCFG